jgi:predicted nucleotidyltransferase
MHTVKVLPVALLATASLLRAAASSASPAPLTILVDFEKPHSPVSMVSMRRELQTLLQPVGLKIDLQLRSQLAPAQEFADLVIFKMKGSCVMEPLPMAALSDERGPLAMAYSSDGEVLHFGEVECDRIRESLGQVMGGVRTSDYRQTLLGRAIGLVIGHELYHMIANSSRHTKSGVTKESLTPHELLEGNLDLPAPARRALLRAIESGRPPASSTGDGFF